MMNKWNKINMNGAYWTRDFFSTKKTINLDTQMKDVNFDII